MRIRSTSSASSPASANRRGAVLLGVVVVVVVMALIAYHYSDRMVAEYQGAANAHRAAQLRCFADSGVHKAAMLLSSPDNIANLLSGNPYDNPDWFRNVRLNDHDNAGNAGMFTLIAPNDPDQSSSSGSYRCGVTDETGKININAFIKRDPTGEKLYAMLVKLPILSTSTELAAAIVDYVDYDSDPRENGAEDDTYSAESPARRCKNGPLDSLDELLLVKGMTREILYGSDLSRNGVMAPDGSTFGAATDRGLSAFLTVTSRESNRDATGQPLININGDDLTVLSEKLAPLIPDDVLKFIILYRQNGPATTTTTATLAVQTTTGRAPVTAQVAPTTTAGNLANYAPDLTIAGSKKLTSFFDLVTAKVSVAGAMGKPATVYSSPMMDLTNLGEALPILFQVASLNDDPEIPAHISVNTAPREVLMCVDGITEANIDIIMSSRPQWNSSEPPSSEFQSLGWLASQAGLSLTTIKNLENALTTRSQVFHMQVVGQFENGTGTTSRVEAIVDANYGRPRIVFYRDWSELGRTKLPQ